MGKGNQAPGPLRTPRARRSNHIACLDACDGLNGHLSRGAVGPIMPLAHGMGHASTAGLNGTLRDPRGEHKGAGAALRMIDFVTGVFLTVRKTALCQERTSSIIAPLRLELPALPALLPALDVPVQKAFSDGSKAQDQRATRPWYGTCVYGWAQRHSP